MKKEGFPAASAPHPQACPAEKNGTRTRILIEASALFARKGYGATSTREIAEAVGIQQPSLFHHFATKAEVVKVLLSYSLDRTTAIAEALAAAQGPAIDRLYAYLFWDTVYLLNSPYQLGGLIQDEVMELPEFRPWYLTRARLRTAREAMISQGIQSGEFLDLGIGFATQVVTGIVISAAGMYSGRRPPEAEELAIRIATFTVRALSVDPLALENFATNPPAVSDFIEETS